MPVLFLLGHCSTSRKTQEKAGGNSGPSLALGKSVSATGSFVAAIASSRIASGGGVFHKPQANDANAANGTDASSPFQQILSTTATGSSAVPPAQGQGASNQGDPGKKSGKDSKADGNAAQSTANQAQQNAVVAAADSKTLLQASATAANTGGQDAASGTGFGSSGATAGADTAAGPASDPSTQQIASDASQTLAATQISVSAQDAKDAKDANTSGNGANDGSDASATLLNSDVNKSAAPTPTVPEDAVAASSASGADTSSDTSKPGKAKRDGQDVAAAQIQTKDASAQINSAQSPVPAAKKDPKSAKTGDQRNSNAANVQATPPDSTVAMAAAAMPLPPAPATTSGAGPNTSDAIAAVATGQAKNAQPNSNSSSNPPDGAKPPAPSGQASNGAANSPSANGAQSSPAGASAAPQDGFLAQSSNASQSTDSKQAGSTSDKGDNQTAAAPVQAQPQVQAAQPQPQAVIPAIQPPLQPHAAATVTQNVQVGPQDVQHQYRRRTGGGDRRQIAKRQQAVRHQARSPRTRPRGSASFHRHDRQGAGQPLGRSAAHPRPA